MKLELTLCEKCLRDFQEVRQVRRKDKWQKIKDPCMICQQGFGYDYVISDLLDETNSVQNPSRAKGV